MIAYILADLGSGMTSGGAVINTAWGSCLSPEGVATISCIVPLFSLLINATLTFGGLVAVIMLIIGGMKMILSGGEAKAAGAARQIITYAILGLVIVLLSFTIVRFIAYLTDVHCIETFGFNTCKDVAPSVSSPITPTPTPYGFT